MRWRRQSADRSALPRYVCLTHTYATKDTALRLLLLSLLSPLSSSLLPRRAVRSDGQHQLARTHSRSLARTRTQAGSLFVFLLFVVLWLYAEMLRWRNGEANKEHQDGTELDVLVDKKANAGGVRTPPRSPRVSTQPGGGGFLQDSFFKMVALDHEALARNRENLRHAVEMGVIILWLYVADRTTIINAGPKEYIRDVFLSIFLILTIVASSYSTAQGRAPRLINRQQTEEWKGWMQVLFLLYHYYEAREVYNAIRVFIASYVWMTGFGNFAYYYKTRDFSAGRFAQMMWRLNLLAIVCCVALNNQYMLYYIWYAVVVDVEVDDDRPTTIARRRTRRLTRSLAILQPDAHAVHRTGVFGPVPLERRERIERGHLDQVCPLHRPDRRVVRVREGLLHSLRAV